MAHRRISPLAALAASTGARLVLDICSESFLRIVGMASSGRNDIAQNHDAYLGDAIRREHAR